MFKKNELKMKSDFKNFLASCMFEKKTLELSSSFHKCYQVSKEQVGEVYFFMYFANL